MSEAKEEAPEERERFQLEILELIKVAQSQNGLRHSDYMRYRQYCARRLRRIRKSLKWTHGRRDFKQKKIETKNVTDARYLQIPLINAERAWAYANQLKQGLTEDTPRYRFHLLRRLSKAAIWAEKLKALCAECGDGRTQLEAEAYCNWMQGNVKLEREDWKGALNKFQQAKKIYKNLSTVSDQEQLQLCQERITSMEPSIRYCTYILQRSGESTNSETLADLKDDAVDAGDEVLQSKLESLMSDSRQKQAQSMSSVQWQGNTVPIKNEKVRVLIIKAKENVLHLLKHEPEADAQDEFDRKMGLFSTILTCYDDALQAVRDEIRLQEKGGKGTKKKASSQNLVSLQAYLTYTKLGQVQQRNQVLADHLASTFEQQRNGVRTKSKRVKPDDLVNLYEKMMATQEQLKADQEAGAAAVSEGIIAAYKAHRTYFLAESYASIPKYAEAYALFRRTCEHVTTAKKAQTGAETKDQASRLETLAQKAQERQYVVHAAALIDKEVETKAAQDGISKMTVSDAQDPAAAGTLMERLNSFSAGDPSQAHQIVQFPPAYQAVPCKPVLFDLAFNDIQYPDVGDRFSEASAPKKEEKPAPASGGWFSWMRGGR